MEVDKTPCQLVNMASARNPPGVHRFFCAAAAGGSNTGDGAIASARGNRCGDGATAAVDDDVGGT